MSMILFARLNAHGRVRKTLVFRPFKGVYLVSASLDHPTFSQVREFVHNIADEALEALRG